MKDRYFKFKRALKKNHYFDLGIPLSRFLQLRSMSDNHFVNKVLALHPERYIDFYEYHLRYYHSIEEGRKEELFFKKVVYVCQNALQDFKSKALKGRSYFWDDKNEYEQYSERLEEFLQKIKECDNWGIILLESEFIQKLKKEIKTLKKEVHECKTPVSSKIIVTKNDLESLIDIFVQLKEYTPDDKNTMLTTQSKQTWPRIICNNFALTDFKEISFSNTEKYFYDARKKHITERKIFLK